MTDDEIRALVEDHGYGSHRLAEALGVSVWQARKTLGRLGLQGRRGGHPSGDARSSHYSVRLTPAEYVRVSALGQERARQALLDAADKEDR